MPESREPQSVIEAAEEAAAAGDYVSAEQLLRDAARLQEEVFGPLHPGLANTLNNLGIVCEIINKPVDAELCYRKACAIATAVLEPDHPFAATSRKNLKDFCEARGTAIEPPVSLPATVTYPKLQVVRFSLPFTIILVSLCGLVLAMLIPTSLWLRANRQAGSTPVSATPSATDGSALVLEPPRPTAIRKEQTSNHRSPQSEKGATAGSAPALTLMSASLCRALSVGGSRDSAGDWRCAPATGPVDSGAVFFYTRLKSPTDTTVQHRWYHGDRLYQAVSLRVQANQRTGYRTYSRHTMSSRSAGNWRVELRSRIGILLHEERFVVR